MAVVQEAHVQGVSTHSVDDLVQAMGMSGLSTSRKSTARSSGAKDSLAAYLFARHVYLDRVISPPASILWRM
ncbi:putative transposase [Bradyrhizobium sp. Rc3b]|uniref:hypothetical protein n=1 Tax=Bradyrhizobium sp. Rc3b TaxID=1855322 RepID=UPI0008F07C25|nr:hypothetical protein [Bradyrhizobium sp. Rc3b]SFN92776.1 putative transposase [Bradyrhizobium sp. Rc3b]